MFFDVLHTVTTAVKKLKLRDPSRGLAPIPKLAFERKICSMHKIFSLLFIRGIWAYLYAKRWSQTWIRCPAPSWSGNVVRILLGLRSFSKRRIWSQKINDQIWNRSPNPILSGIWLLIGLHLDSDYDSYINSTWSIVLIWISWDNWYLSSRNMLVPGFGWLSWLLVPGYPHSREPIRIYPCRVFSKIVAWCLPPGIGLTGSLAVLALLLSILLGPVLNWRPMVL